MKTGQEVWLKPGVWGYGYYTPLEGSEQFRLRGSIWNYASWYFLGIVTDTAQPDLNASSTVLYVEYKNPEGNLYYIKIDESLEGRLEFRDPADGNTDVNFETLVVKESQTLPWWKRNLSLLLGIAVMGIGLTVAIAANRKKTKTQVKKASKSA